MTFREALENQSRHSAGSRRRGNTLLAARSFERAQHSAATRELGRVEVNGDLRRRCRSGCLQNLGVGGGHALCLPLATTFLEHPHARAILQEAYGSVDADFI